MKTRASSRALALGLSLAALLLTTCTKEETVPSHPVGAGGAASAVTGGSGGAGVTPAGGSGGSNMIAGGGGVGGSAGANAGGGPAVSGSGGTGGSPLPPPLGSWPPPALELTEVAEADQPTAIAASPDDPTRLFFVEKAGRVRVIKDGVLLPAPALDISDQVLEGDPPPGGGDKRGAIGLAFHPGYAENGRLFVMYAGDQNEPGHTPGDLDDGDVIIEEYARGATADVFEPEPKALIIRIDKGTCSPCYQHNGGSLEVSPDGFLYASMGDPPPYDDDGAQDLNTALGKMLRYDISQATVTAAGNYPGAAPYVWDIGLRNPYKFSFDRVTGDMYIADVGENTWEEISIERAGEGHKNFGWPMREGMHGEDCAECVDPVTEYGHDNADNAVIGGMVYRGTNIPDLAGTYLYGDNGSGRIRALQAQNGELVNGPMVLPDLNVKSACFGQDHAGELYVCGYSEGKIFRIDAK